MGRLDLAYFAGFIDGEGCISIATQGRSLRDKSFVNYRLEVRVGSTNLWVLQLLKMQFAGWIYPMRKPIKPTHKQCWVWVIYSKQAREVLEVLLPYLKLKKAEAEVGIAWQKDRRSGRKQTDKEKAVNEAQKLLMQNLKKVEVQDNR